MPSQVDALIDAYRQHDHAAARTIVASIPNALLLEAVDRSPDCAEVVRAACKALMSSESPVQRTRLPELLADTFDRIETGEVLSEGQAKSLLSFFSSELDVLPLNHVADTVCHSLAHLRSSLQRVGEVKMHQLLPKCLALLATADTVSYTDDTGRHVTHYADFQELVLVRLCEVRWPSRSVLLLLGTLRELPLTEAQIRMVVDKTLRGAPELDLQALPALVYQLLLLAGRGCRLEVLCGLAAHFDRLERRARAAQVPEPGDDGGDDDGDDSGDGIAPCQAGVEVAMASQEIRHAADAGADPEMLAAVRSTVALNVDLAMRQDHALGTTLLRVLRSHTLQLSSFSLALLLLLARQPRFEDEALAWLTTAVRGGYNEAAWMFASPWLDRALIPLRAPRIASMLARLTEPTGPEHLLPSVVALATAWMDAVGGPGGSGGPSGGKPAMAAAAAAHSGLQDAANAGAGADSDVGVAGEEERGHALSGQHRLARLAAKTLVGVFRGHPAAHTEILELALARIASRSPSCGRWVALVARLVALVPTAMMHHLQRLRESLAYAAHLPADAGIELVRALLPLSAHRQDLRDAIIIALRKAAFLRDESSRLIAIRGFLLILARTDVNGAGGSGDAGGAAEESTRADAEMLGFCKRCLAHQYSVRAALYAGLPEVYAARPHLRAPILEMLESQMGKYYETSLANAAPIDLSSCIAHSTASAGGAPGPGSCSLSAEVEPLGDLLRCLARCAAHSPAGAREAESARALVSDVLGRMRSASLADFGLDKAADLSATTAYGRSNAAGARVLQGALVACMEIAISPLGLEVAAEEDLALPAALYSVHAEVSALLKAGSGWGGTGASRAGIPKAERRAGVAGSARACSTTGTAHLALAPSIRLLTLATAHRAGRAAAAGARDAGDDAAPAATAEAPGGLQGTQGEALLRFAVQSAQASMHGLGPADRGAAGRAVLPLLLRCADLHLDAMNDGDVVRAANAKSIGTMGKQGDGAGKARDGRTDRPLAAVALEATEALFVGAPDRAAVVDLLRAAADAEHGDLSAAGHLSATSPTDGHVTDAGAPPQTTVAQGAAMSSALRDRLEPLLDSLLGAETAASAKVAEACLRAARALATRLPAQHAAAHAEWASAQCRRELPEAFPVSTARALVGYWLHLADRAHGSTLTAARMVLEEARHHVGRLIGGQGAGTEEEEDDDAELAAPHGLLAIHEANATAMAAVALDSIDSAITDVERCLAVVKRVQPATSSVATGADVLGTQESGPPAHPAAAMQLSALTRLREICDVMGVCMNAQLGGTSAERSLRTAERLYRALGAAFGIARKVTPTHHDIVQVHWQRLSVAVYGFISYHSGHDNPSVSNGKRTKRELRIVPALVFRIEAFESVLVRLAKKHRLDLTSQMRRSTARDFKIHLEQIPEADMNATQTGHKRKRGGKKGAKCEDDEERDAAGEPAGEVAAGVEDVDS